MTGRWAFYLMSIASLGVLAVIFYQRGQWPWAVGFVVLGLFYLGRGLWLQHREVSERREDLMADLARRQTSAEKRAIVSNLLDTRDHLRGARQRNIFYGALVFIGVVLIYPTNIALAFALSVLLLPLAFLIIRHTRAINTIQRGLLERNLVPRS